ncbi:hypothetical protein [Streptomyces sp. 6N223]|uniref:hypothetical protein n=1 Tax=Streptomyces sp. 6N223 TaxID=3457412 RepID=UPI003FD32F41
MNAAALLLAGVLIFLAGAGTSLLYMGNKMNGVKDSMRDAMSSGMLDPGGGGSPGAGGGPPTGGGSSGLSPEAEAWAQEQGIPTDLDPMILERLYAQFPDGVPPETLDMICAQLGC